MVALFAGRGQSIPLKSLLWLTQALALLCRHGVPLVSALESLSAQAQSPRLQELLTEAALDLREGLSLSCSLRSRCASLPGYYAEMLFAAEESGSFDQVLGRLESHLEREVALRRELISASLYPAFAAVVSLIVGLLVLTLIVPSFRDLFAEIGAPLPWATRAALSLSDIATALLVPLLAALPLAFALARTPLCRQAASTVLQRVPVYGRFLERCSLARVTGTTATLIGAGMQLSRALELSAHAAGNDRQRRELLLFSRQVVEGTPLSRLLAASSCFPRELSGIAELGESSGALDEVLLASSKLYESEARESAALLKASVEPLLVVTVGIFVGGLMLAVYLPIFGLGGVAQ